MEKQYKRYVTQYGIKWCVSEHEMYYNGVYTKDQIKAELINEMSYKIAKTMVEHIIKSENDNGNITYNVNFNVISKDPLTEDSFPVTVNYDTKI